MKVTNMTNQPARLKYDPFAVRRSFRQKWCKALVLPSGKTSDYYFFPIDSTEITSLTEDLTKDDFLHSSAKDFCKNESEFLMWVALRKKYGFSYLVYKQKIQPAHIEKQVDEEAEKIAKIYYDFESSDDNVFDELSRKIIDLSREVDAIKKDKKFFA